MSVELMAPFIPSDRECTATERRREAGRGRRWGADIAPSVWLVREVAMFSPCDCGRSNVAADWEEPPRLDCAEGRTGRKGDGIDVAQLLWSPPSPSDPSHATSTQPNDIESTMHFKRFLGTLPFLLALGVSALPNPERGITIPLKRAGDRLFARASAVEETIPFSVKVGTGGGLGQVEFQLGE